MHTEELTFSKHSW